MAGQYLANISIYYILRMPTLNLTTRLLLAMRFIIYFYTTRYLFDFINFFL